MGQRVPEVAVRRLPVYLRVVEELIDEGEEIVSSAELSGRSGITSEQIRKDLAYFGAFGTRGVGYSTTLLQGRIRDILGVDRPVSVALVGAGNLGTALCRYNLSRHKDVKIQAVFDSDWDKIGKRIEDVEILPMEDLPDVVAELGIRLAIIAVPAGAAQGVADLLVGHGVGAILNFSPAKLSVPEGCVLQSIDLTTELQSLAYYIKSL